MNKWLEIVRLGVSAGQAWAFYDLGVGYEHGYATLPRNENLAWRLYRRAAELGSPEAQMALATAYERADRLDARATMIKCAYQQGFGPAAYDLAMEARARKRYSDAVSLFQDGVRFGHKDSAGSLMLLFGEAGWAGTTEEEARQLQSLGLAPDPERYRRYREIAKALAINPDLRLPRIDESVPLPPAKLPNWNGIRSAQASDANTPPKY